MCYGTFTLTGKATAIDGTAHQGSARIDPSCELRDSAGKVILAGRVEVALDAAGSFTVTLPAADASLSPQPHGFTVTWRLRSAGMASKSFAAPAPGVTLDLASVPSGGSLPVPVAETPLTATDLANLTIDGGSL